MSDAANALQQAIYATLSADTALTAMIGSGSIFDHRLSGRPMPYLVIADFVTTDFGPDAEEHTITIEAWSDAEGRKQVQAIADRVKRLLHDADLSLAGATLVNLQHRASRVKRQVNAKAFSAEMTFRAVTE